MNELILVVFAGSALMALLLAVFYSVPIGRTWNKEHGDPAPDVTHEIHVKRIREGENVTQRDKDERRLASALQGSFPASDALSSWAGPPRKPTPQA